MKFMDMVKRYGGLCALVIDAGALIAFYALMPVMRRPLEILAVLLAVLGIATMLLVKTNVIRSLALVVVSLALGVFGLEMAQKTFNFLDVTKPKAFGSNAGEGSPYVWNSNDSASYFAALDAARRDGVEPEALVERFSGELPVPREELTVQREQGSGRVLVTEGVERLFSPDSQLGYELTPGALVRGYGYEEKSGRRLFDVHYTINADGVRQTRNSADADEAYVFLGCSNTFGQYLHDDETVAHYFSEGLGFDKKVVNMGVSGWGPSHVLRDLELDRHLGRSGLGGRTVRGAYFTLINDHVHRVATARIRPTPNYALGEDGRPRYIRTVFSEADDSFWGRLSGMMERSRVYPVIRDRLFYRIHAGDPEYNRRLMVAVLAEIDRILRERHQSPLTIIYWDNDQALIDMLRQAGLEVLPVEDAFVEGADWQRMAIKYQVFDLHPSAYANKRIAGMLLARHGAVGVPDGGEDESRAGE